MDLPSRAAQPAPAQTSREDSRYGDNHIDQRGSRFGNTQVTGGLAFQGNFVGLTIHATASARADYMGHYAHGSLHPVETFVERPELREQIRRLLVRDGSEPVQLPHKSRILAIWGLGGMGKTQLVLDYLQRHRSDYKATFWIEAGQKSTVERDFVNIYQLLFDVSMSARLSGQDRLAEAVLRVKNWFSQRHERWLFVFDGADSMDNPDDREYVDLLEFIPGSSTVDIIIISRSRTVEDLATLGSVNVDEMDQQQAVELFYNTSRLVAPTSETENEVKHIVEELGYLALAISLAGIYVRETPRLRSNICGYLVEYRQRRRELLLRKPTRVAHQYSESVLTTWETSFRAVQKQYPAAAYLLTLLAFLSHDDIYLDLFGLDNETSRAEHHDIEHRDLPVTTWRTAFFPEQPPDIYTVEEGFRVLERYSLVHWKGDQESYRMHRLVHAWGYDRLSTVKQENLAAGSVGLVSDAMSRCGTAPQDKMRLSPHIMTSFRLVSSAASDRHYAEDLLNQVQRMSVFLDELGRWSDVQLIETFMLNAFRRIFGDEDPSTISAVSNLATILRDQGQFKEAAAMLKEVLKKRRRVLGEEHPDTISAMNNLATILRDQGQLEEAAAMSKEVLEKRRRVLGEEHPSTISAMNNLATILRDQGQLEEAAATSKEVLEKRRRVLGEEHPDTIMAMNNLATILGDQGQLEKAVAMSKEVLKKSRRVLGDEHPDTISAMSNLASILGDQGQPPSPA